MEGNSETLDGNLDSCAEKRMMGSSGTGQTDDVSGRKTPKQQEWRKAESAVK